MSELEHVAPPPGFKVVKPGYCVNEWGATLSCAIRGYRGGIGNEWRPLKPFLHRSGYMQVCLGRRDKRYVHRLVLEEFVSPAPPEMECRHLDGDTKNNYVENLAWGTRKQNAEDMVRHGRSNKGKLLPSNAKLSKGDVLEVLVMRQAGKKIRDIACHFGVCDRTIEAILRGELWCHTTGKTKSLLGPSRGEANPAAKLTMESVREIRRLAVEGQSQRKIAKILGVSQRTVWSVLGGKTWSHVV